jgi:hypothetical protein
MIRLQVECYAGYKADQRPVRFTVGTRSLNVVSVDEQWYSPATMYFRIQADDGNIYILRHDEGQDTCDLEAFRWSANS